MGFSSECWYSFHYSDSEGYLIFCCHDVASSVAAKLYVRIIIPYKKPLIKFITTLILNTFYYPL